MKISLKKIVMIAIIIAISIILIKVFAQPSQSYNLYESVKGLNGLRLF